MTPFSPIVTTSGCEPVEADALVAVLAEDHRLAVLEDEHPVLADLAVGEVAKAPSLKMLQFWRTSTNAEPWWRPARLSVSCRCSVWVSTVRATNVASAASATVSGWIGVSTVPSRRRLGLLAELGRRASLALGQAVDPVVEHHHLDVDVAPHRVQDVVAADRERVAVAGDHPHHQLRAGEPSGRWRASARGRGWCGSRRCSCSTAGGRSSRCRR